jgi:hypothetical protein
VRLVSCSPANGPSDWTAAGGAMALARDPVSALSPEPTVGHSVWGSGRGPTDATAPGQYRQRAGPGGGACGDYSVAATGKGLFLEYG